jgi:hypothetical protein
MTSQLYGKDIMRPNHHYATDVPDCLRDFGPMVGFWTFLFERLNKILKSYNSANHSGGELEVSFFREFHRTIRHARVVRCSSFPNECAILKQLVDEHRITSW